MDMTAFNPQIHIVNGGKAFEILAESTSLEDEFAHRCLVRAVSDVKLKLSLAMYCLLAMIRSRNGP
jgi:hypothetical protein